MSLGCRALTDLEITLLLNNLSQRDGMLFTLGLKTGFRISELLSVKIDDLKEFNGQLKTCLVVARANMKGKHASRSVPLSLDVQELLKQYLKTLPIEQLYLFESQKGSCLSRHQAWRAIKTAARQANIVGKVATHSARKTVAMRAYKASGNDLALTQRVLGHRNVSSTISYLNIEPENLSAVWDKIQK